MKGAHQGNALGLGGEDDDEEAHEADKRGEEQEDAELQGAHHFRLYPMYPVPDVLVSRGTLWQPKYTSMEQRCKLKDEFLAKSIS